MRRERRIYRAISMAGGVPVATVARALRRAGLNRLSALDPAPPVTRYEHDAPGDLLHIDIKKLGRFRGPGHRVTSDRQAGHSYRAGWDYVHIAIDDHSRASWATIKPDETGASTWRALIAAVRYYRRLGIRHRRTEACRPRANGQAERLIQTALRERAYARATHTTTDAQRICRTGYITTTGTALMPA